MKKKKGLIALVAMLGIVLITAGATYAWFSYSKSGTKGNTISSGSITFHYQEGAQGLSLNDAMPMTDAQGKAQNTYFDFNITSKTTSTVEIPYDITVRRSGTGTNMDNVVKVYLTKVDNGVETPVELIVGRDVAKVSELNTYLNDVLNIDATKNEKKLSGQKVPSGSSNYNQAYRLRMWISDDANFALVPAHCSDNSNKTENECVSPAEWIEEEYPYNNKTYTLKVNVYGEGVISIPDQPGLYDANGNLIETYDSLVSKYGFDTTKGFVEDNDHHYYHQSGGDWYYYDANWNEIKMSEDDLRGIPVYVLSKSEYSNATKLILPKSVIEIGANAFISSELKEIAFEEGSQLTSIGSSAFQYTGITSITIPSSVTSIGENAFSGIKVVFYDGTAVDDGNHWGATCLNPYIEGDFAYSDNTKTNLLAYVGNSSSVIIPSSVTSIGSKAFEYTNISSITIPSSVTSIGVNAFSSCENLTSVTFEEGSQLTSIGDFAFSGSNISSITIPSSLTSIGDDTFSSCKNLTLVTFEEGSQLTSIGSGVFADSNISSITIPSSVTSIGARAFNSSNISSITIPSSVTSIRAYAFASCANLTSVTFANPNGWSANGTALSSTDLSNTSTAATYLKRTYDGSTWTRSE